jgi:type I restriction enzyme S subunit
MSSDVADREDACRILKVSAVTWNDYDPDESKPVPRDYEAPSHHYVRAGDLLFSRANTTELVGAVAYVFNTPPNRLLPDKIWRFVFGGKAVEPLYVWQLFLQKSIRDEIGRRATGTSGSMKNISMERVLDIEVPLPPIHLQQQFALVAAKARRHRALLVENQRQNDFLFKRTLEDSYSSTLGSELQKFDSWLIFECLANEMPIRFC